MIEINEESVADDRTTSCPGLHVCSREKTEKMRLFEVCEHLLNPRRDSALMKNINPTYKFEL